MILSENYTVVKEFKTVFNPEQFNEKIVQVLYKYDLIVGDYADNQLRLKGFYYNRRRNVNPLRKESRIRKYLDESCNYMCPHFIVEKVSNVPEPPKKAKHKRRPRLTPISEES